VGESMLVVATRPHMPQRPDDMIVNLLSHWLARHAGDDELRDGVAAIGTDDLSPQQAEAVEELLADFDDVRDSGPGELERLVRETLEAVALG
jgi:hypothetical protein